MEDREEEEERSAKRRRLSRQSSIEATPTKPQEPAEEIQVCVDTITVRPTQVTSQDDASVKSDRTASLATPDKAAFCTPKTIRTAVAGAMPNTSPLSSPPIDINPPTSFQNRTYNFIDVALPASSSPLSSPPAVFDPFGPSSPSDTTPSRRSSISQSDEGSNSNPFPSSQLSNAGRTSLPNMKGKDLFDASIWADPLRTSVFYTFATSLRQKVRDCEPTTSHRFISHLKERGKLVRCYTQNIDRIEEKVGLSTSLQDGPGSRGRFSRRSTANASQLRQMVEEDSSNDLSGLEGSSQAGNDSSQTVEGSDGTITPNATGEAGASDQAKSCKPPRLEPSRSSGVECVFLHGSLECLRCFLCGRITSWDDARELETLSGQQPECPHCIGATVARENRGKRALGVGKLRPDIVLYGEEHPNSHLISPIVTHDLGLCPDMLLILGTSLRVHGLKVLVREFAKAIHNRGGKVVFVNFTKPPESSWGDVIDYWVQWDCDAWVADLQNKVPKLWEAPPPPKRRKTEEEKVKERKERPPPANPVALRDTKVVGAYWTTKIMSELYRITETESLTWRISSTSQSAADAKEPKSRQSPAMKSLAEPPLESEQEAIMVKTEIEVSSTETSIGSSIEAEIQVEEKPNFAQKTTKAKAKRTRKSAPGALERSKKPRPSTLNPDHGRARKSQAQPTISTPPSQMRALLSSPSKDTRTEINSILNSVKDNPRIRKRKKIDGEEVVLPSSKPRKSASAVVADARSDLTLAPITNRNPPTPPQLDHRPRPLEPASPPAGPMTTLTAKMISAGRSAGNWMKYCQDIFQLRPTWGPSLEEARIRQQQQEHREFRERPFLESEQDAAMTLAGMAVPRHMR